MLRTQMFLVEHRGELGLASRAFEESAAQKAHADADAQGAEADQNRNRDRRQTNHNIHQCLRSRVVAFKKETGGRRASARLPCREPEPNTRS